MHPPVCPRALIAVRPLQVKLLEQPGQVISIAQFLGKAVEPPLQQSVTSAIQVGGWGLQAGACLCGTHWWLQQAA